MRRMQAGDARRTRAVADAINPALLAAFARAIPGRRGTRLSAGAWLVVIDDCPPVTEIDEGEPGEDPG
jgi:hypothetical protein